MKEDLLHYVWRLKKFELNNLQTTDGEEITIIQFGNHNSHAGADFLNARISIGETVWGGNVEMHLKSSDWVKHKHSDDDAYNNVILHVVYEEDVPIFRSSGEKIPCLELKGRISERLRSQYLRLLHNEKRIPCEGLHDSVSDFTWKMWLDGLLVERLENKILPIEREMKLTKNDREEVFYRFLARNFGVKVNAYPFEHLARSLPLKVLAKHKNNLFAIEALLFGQAGMLDIDFKDEYPKQLKKEYEFLKKKYELLPIHLSEWKMLRLRPANFPTIRIAQFAALVHQSQRLFSRILWAQTISDIENLFDVGVSEYWTKHYVFDKESEEKEKHLGKSTIRLIIINTIVPFLFHYGMEKQEPAFKTKAMNLLRNVKSEKNHIINVWDELGIKAGNASESQALLQLKNEYCNKKRCLNCKIGHQILGKNSKGILKTIN